MKILDSFIFCDEYEKELVLLKLILENDKVDEFIGVECHYDYHGRYKGPILETMIKNDNRFQPYLNKIKVISVAENLSCYNPSLEQIIDPKEYANAEVRLRNASTEYLLGKYDDNDYVFTTDVDEAIDFTDNSRSNRILAWLKTGNPIQFERIRYIYNYNNRAVRSKMDCVNPAYKIKHLKSGVAKLSDKKWVGVEVPVNQNPCIFEFCFCFPYEGILSKYNTSLHTKWAKPKIDQSLRTNTWTMTEYQTLDKNNRYLWFEVVELTENNSPKYVRDNFEQLDTKLVPANYRENRIAEFGENPNFPDNWRDIEAIK